MNYLRPPVLDLAPRTGTGCSADIASARRSTHACPLHLGLRRPSRPRLREKPTCSALQIPSFKSMPRYVVNV